MISVIKEYFVDIKEVLEVRLSSYLKFICDIFKRIDKEIDWCFDFVNDNLLFFDDVKNDGVLGLFFYLIMNEENISSLEILMIFLFFSFFVLGS